MIIKIFSIALLSSLFLLGLAISSSAQTPANLSGKWKLKAEESDETKAKVEQAVKDANISPLFAGVMRNKLQKAIDKVISEKIVVDDRNLEVDITNGDNPLQTYYTDKRKEKIEREGKTADVVVSRAKNQIIIELTNPDGVLTRTFTLDEKKKRLRIETKLVSPKSPKPVIIQSIYVAEK